MKPMLMARAAFLIFAMLTVASASAAEPGSDEAFALVIVKCPQNAVQLPEHSRPQNDDTESVFLTLADVASYSAGSHTLVLRPSTMAAHGGRPSWLELERYSQCSGFEVRVHGRCVYAGAYHSVVRSVTAGPGVYVSGFPFSRNSEDRIAMVLVQPCLDPRDAPELMKVFEDAGVLVK